MNIRRAVRVRLAVSLVVAGALAGAAYFVAAEMRTSELQARYFSTLSAGLTYRVEPGSSDAVRYPQAGPYDERLGYTALPRFIGRLQKRGFAVSAQARFSPQLLKVADHGLFPVYLEKTQAGLTILDSQNEPLFSTVYPERVYPAFETIPPVVLRTLLFIENRELLDEQYPHRNPAVEWDRLARATMDFMARKLGVNIGVPGGSTLATQLEKYRHSPGGRTDTPGEKLRQMGSAALRAYLGGPDTTHARRAIALAYLNSMPLAAAPGHGEVHGLGDGLWAWFGADFATVNRLLIAPDLDAGERVTPEQGHAYRQVLCLLLAQRRPAFYLMAGRGDLQRLADRHLRLLARERIIPSALRDAALLAESELLSEVRPAPANLIAGRKTEGVLRTRLATALGVPRLYDLDRIDATARATLDQRTQNAVAEALRQLKDPAAARAAGVMGFRLLDAGNDLGDIVYSLILFERTPQGNLLRIQTDNYDQPLDINEGIKLDLGSTAKLRTMVHYLELIATLHQQYSDDTPAELRAVQLHPRDYLSRWVIDQLLTHPHIPLAALLDAALERRYSASPYEAFMTGGGIHTFANFNEDDNHKIMSVRVALQESVNLVFVRLMRDVVYHHLYRPEGLGRWLDEENSTKRTEYLERFADLEGQTYLRRFFRKYHGKTQQEALALLTTTVRPIAKRLATVYRSVLPHDGLVEFSRYLKAHLPGHVLSGEDIAALYDQYSIDRFDLHDRGYIARVHPLELWLVGYLAKHPDATLSEVVAASAFERQQVYRWLFKTRRPYAQQKRIRMLVEQEAFAQIHRAWKRLGYPFAHLTPSYATAIGASGDRPVALAELLGILLNDGVRYPMQRFDFVHFAAGTPYETLMALPQVQGQRVLQPEVAAAARQALISVVESGTARRIHAVYKDSDGRPLVIAGKTGTGDHRRQMFGSGGRLIDEQVVSRTATFAFMLGDRHFGALTAYVTGPAAAHYRFTSALPVQVLKSLAPILEPMIVRSQTHSPPASGAIVAAVAHNDAAKQASSVPRK